MRIGELVRQIRDQHPPGGRVGGLEVKLTVEGFPGEVFEVVDAEVEGDTVYLKAGGE